MRKILSLLIIGVLVTFMACDKLNEKPEFSDSNAFVEFNSTSLAVKESGGTLKIPVTLASLKGLSTSVTYTVVDTMKAKEGTNFTLVDATKTLTFDASNRTQYIEINIIDNPGVYTGDLKFQIQLSDAGTVKPSAENVCTVTITDNDHPLAAILGDWNANGTSYFYAATSWKMTLTKDAKDVSIVWISNFVPSGTSELIYGVVNAAQTEIKIPIQQVIATSTSYSLIRIDGWYGPSGDVDIPAGGYISCTISADKSSITINDWYGSHIVDNDKWYNIMEAGVVLTR